MGNLCIKLQCIICLLFSCITIDAEDFDIGHLSYTITSSTAKTVGVRGNTGFNTDTLIIPPSVTYEGITYSVTSIGEEAFYRCSGLTSVTIPNSVTTIERKAFYCCDSLKSVVIPNGIKIIGYYAFQYCNLSEIHIPASVTDIGDYAFVWNPNLQSVTVDSGNKVYSAPANKNVIMKGDTVVLGCRNAIIPENAKVIGNGAFNGFKGVTSISIPDGVTSIGNWAFDGCSDLTSITIPNSVTNIGFNAFLNCSGLTSVKIGNGVTSIDASGFRGYFYGCDGLMSIVVDSGNSIYDSREGCNAIIETATNILIAGCKNTIIPSDVTTIGSDAFYGCSGLTSITIPNSVTTIGSSAFYNCSGLSEIYVKATTPPAIYNNTFGNRTATLYVPTGTKALYQEANIWKEFSNIVEMDFPSIGDVDNDEVVDVADVTTLVSIILGVETGTAAADVDSDGAVDVADVTTLVSIILGTYEPPLPPSLSFSQAEFAVNVGDILDLTSYLEITSISLNDLTWSTSNPKVLTVAGGAVTALQCGEATVTVRYNSEFIAECRINVIDAPDAGGSEGTGEEEW